MNRKSASICAVLATLYMTQPSYAKEFPSCDKLLADLDMREAKNEIYFGGRYALQARMQLEVEGRSKSEIKKRYAEARKEARLAFEYRDTLLPEHQGLQDYYSSEKSNNYFDELLNMVVFFRDYNVKYHTWKNEHDSLTKAASENDFGKAWDHYNVLGEMIDHWASWLRKGLLEMPESSRVALRQFREWKIQDAKNSYEAIGALITEAEKEALAQRAELLPALEHRVGCLVVRLVQEKKEKSKEKDDADYLLLLESLLTITHDMRAFEEEYPFVLDK